MFRPIIDSARSFENVFVVLLISIAIFFWISPLMNAESLEKQESQTQSVTQIELNPNLTEQRELQAAVDHGDQPWRLDPVDVAISALGNIENNLESLNCWVASESKSAARVDCKGSNDYSVILRRIVKPNGIWTAVSITIR